LHKGIVGRMAKPQNSSYTYPNLEIQPTFEYSMFGEYPAYGLYVRHASGISIKDIRFSLDESDFRPAFVFDDVSGVEMAEIEIPTLSKGQIILKDTEWVDLDKEASILARHY